MHFTELTHEVQWRRRENQTYDAGPWRRDAFYPYHESEAAAQSYVRSVAVGGRIEFRVIKRDA